MALRRELYAHLRRNNAHAVQTRRETCPRPLCVNAFDRSVRRGFREVTGDEKATWWDRAVAAFPPYADYQAKTERQIPVFVASRRR